MLFVSKDLDVFCMSDCKDWTMPSDGADRIIFDFCALEHLGENNPAANLSLGRQTRPKPVAQFRNAEEVDFVEQSGEICVIWVRNAPRSQEVKDDFKQARIAVDKYPILRVELQKRMEEIYLSV